VDAWFSCGSEYLQVARVVPEAVFRVALSPVLFQMYQEWPQGRSRSIPAFIGSC
jgi:hypothetical protein